MKNGTTTGQVAHFSDNQSPRGLCANHNKMGMKPFSSTVLQQNERGNPTTFPDRLSSADEDGGDGFSFCSPGDLEWQ